MTLIFAVLVVAGFLFKLLASFGKPGWAENAAWGCWLVAAMIWAVTASGLHAGA